MVNRQRIALAIARRWGRLNSHLVRWLWARGEADAPARLGTEYGGWYCYTGSLRAGQVALCVGAGEDVSFDVLLNAQYGLRVVCVDPTPRAVQHVEQLLAARAIGRSSLPVGSGDDRYALGGFDADRFELVPRAVWSSDTELELYLPRDPTHVSLSAVNLQGTDRSVRVRAQRIESLLREIHVDEVALLKMDIEGAEYEVLDDLLRSPIRPRQLLVEFEDLNQPRTVLFLPRLVGLLRRLRAANYRLCHVDGANFLLKQLAADVRGSTAREVVAHE